MLIYNTIVGDETMNPSTNLYEAIIIGSGQAGLAAAYYLKEEGIDFLLLDSEQRIGDSWRRRYDSLTLFTPKRYSQLPGLFLDGEAEQFPAKDEIADYLERYAEHFQFAVQLDTKVVSLSKPDKHFLIETSKGSLFAKQVIVATGPFQRPNIPTYASQLDGSVLQLHTSQFHNSSDLQDGNVLIVGGGNSGAQLAVELAKERQVTLSVHRQPSFLPLHIWRKSIFWWLDKLGLLYAPTESLPARLLQKRGDPIFGLELQDAIKQGQISLKPGTFGSLKREMVFADQSRLEVSNVIWATGFRADYSWIKLPLSIGDKGLPDHTRGVTSIEGLYFVGLPWQSHRGSALLAGVGRDAQWISRILSSRR